MNERGKRVLLCSDISSIDASATEKEVEMEGEEAVLREVNG